ncbi:hypothetical protein HV346_11890 [Enterobacter sp. RHBSTW-00994]|uniref:hypothetical protein n=1 Tax=Enterobacter sp. RHBSTW-00994 TaxID=2742676 RepID=UPI0015E96B89|nr:hypothetical protein [Enterobacter sp. RHBSTW-00994]QLR43339.1 hypothetical protein HV346_11890 [Enterobacter sp. RHBSTW-00994]
MTPLFSVQARWANRTLLGILLLSLPLIGFIINEKLTQRDISMQLDLAQRQLTTQQRLHQQWLHARPQKSPFQHNRPWALIMLDRLGSVLTSEISLSAIDVDAKKKEMRLSVKATSLTSLLTFTAHLQSLATVTLENHQQSADDNPLWPLTAAVTLHFDAEKADVRAH